MVLFHYGFRGHAADNLSLMPYRALAPVVKYGYLGVELFFMISGFVILMTASRGSLRDFVVSRISRLYPAFWVCCTITFLVTLVIGAPYFSASLPQYLANMTMLSEPAGISWMDGAYWSLFVEIKFYCLVAVVLALRKLHWIEWLLALWLMVAVCLEIYPVALLVYVTASQSAAFFVAGSCCYLIWSRGGSLCRLGLIGVSWLMALYQSIKALGSLEIRYQAPMNPWIVGGIITVFFLIMLAVSFGKTKAISSRRWVLAGAVTYPLYLLHQNIGYMVFNKAYPAVNPHLLLWGMLGLMLLLAYGVHRFIERPIIAPLKKGVSRLWDALPEVRSAGFAKDRKQTKIFSGRSGGRPRS